MMHVIFIEIRRRMVFHKEYIMNKKLDGVQIYKNINYYSI